MAEKMTIARPYAKAVFECATEMNTIAKWAEALQVLAIIAKNEKVLALLQEDAILLQEIVGLFVTICKSTVSNSLGDQLQNFVLLLAQRKRLKILPEIGLLYKKMQLDSENKIEVKLESSVSLDENQQTAYQNILEKYLARKVAMECAVNTNLLGGFLAKAGNFVIDGSIRGSLTNLKTVMGD